MKSSKNINKLPIPRLELSWEKDGVSWVHRVCNYCLVLPLSRVDCRASSTACDEFKVLIGQTTVSGGTGEKPVRPSGEVNVPFRDCAHIQWDNEALGGHLPMYAVCGKEYTLIEPTKD